MALIECPECKGQVSNTVRHCPHCGFHVQKCGCRHHGCFPMLPLLFLGLAVIVFLFLIFAAGVNVNSNNGMINFNWHKRGIMPRLRFFRRCGGKGK
jgi:hypothetical protein